MDSRLGTGTVLALLPVVNTTGPLITSPVTTRLGFTVLGRGQRQTADRHDPARCHQHVNMHSFDMEKYWTNERSYCFWPVFLFYYYLFFYIYFYISFIK